MNEYVEINPRICGGKPVIRGTRIPLTVIVDQLAESGSIERLRIKYPELSQNQVIGALHYCHAIIDRTELDPVSV